MDDKLRIGIKAELYKLRTRFDLTLTAFADKLGVVPNTIRNWENPNIPTVPDAVSILVICREFDVSPSEVLGSPVYERVQYLKGILDGLLIQHSEVESLNPYWNSMINGANYHKLNKLWNESKGFKWLLIELEHKCLYKELIRFTVALAHFMHSYMYFEEREHFSAVAIDACEKLISATDQEHSGEPFQKRYYQWAKLILKADARAWIAIEQGQYRKAQCLLIESIREANNISNELTEFSDERVKFDEILVLAYSFLARSYLIENSTRTYHRAILYINKAHQKLSDSYVHEFIMQRHFMVLGQIQQAQYKKTLDVAYLDKAKESYIHATEKLRDEQTKLTEASDSLLMWLALCYIDMAQAYPERRDLYLESVQDTLGQMAYSSNDALIESRYRRYVEAELYLCMDRVREAQKLADRILLPEFLHGGWLQAKINRILTQSEQEPR